MSKPKNPPRAWRTHEVQFLRENYPQHGAAFCAHALGRTRSSIHNQADKLGLRMNRVAISSSLEALKSWCRMEDGCWVWLGAMNNGKHPVVVHPTRSARQVAFELSGGAVKAGHVMRCTCGNERCINPAHMRQASRGAVAKENRHKNPLQRRIRVQQAFLSNGTAKLNMDKARAIRASDKRSADLAAEFGVTVSHINAVRRGDAWPEAAGLWAGMGAR